MHVTKFQKFNFSALTKWLALLIKYGDPSRIRTYNLRILWLPFLEAGEVRCAIQLRHEVNSKCYFL